MNIYIDKNTLTKIKKRTDLIEYKHVILMSGDLTGYEKTCKEIEQLQLEITSEISFAVEGKLKAG